MIHTLQIRDFKAHRDTKLTFERLTMLVGDNASGKTSVLDALAIMAGFNPLFRSTLPWEWHPGDVLRRGSTGTIRLNATGVTNGLVWNVTIDQDASAPPHDVKWIARLNGTIGAQTLSGTADTTSYRYNLGLAGWEQIGQTLGPARLYVMRADRIAAAAYSSNPEAWVEHDGTNTAVVLAAMKLGDDEAFTRIQDAIRTLIPSIERLHIRPAKVQTGEGERNGYKIYFDFRGAPGVPAHGASHGTLIVLALLTILHGPHRPNVVLLDDFDHALHPRAQIELVRMIKELLSLRAFADVQVVATTHSPYVLDELQPSQIHAFALRDDGTVATKPLSEHPEAAKVQGKLTAGQLWSLDPEREWVLRE